MDLSATRSWLRTVLQAYRDPERTFRDVDAVLQMYANLKPKMDNYTYDNGHTQLLLCLQGTVPITYRKNPYNIPMAFWIPSDYPLHPPIPYVKPTPTMWVKKNNNVDVSGLCYHPYRSDWGSDIQNHNIVELIYILQQVFSEEPPVYTKPPGSAPYPSYGMPMNNTSPRPNGTPPPIPLKNGLGNLSPASTPHIASTDLGNAAKGNGHSPQSGPLDYSTRPAPATPPNPPNPLKVGFQYDTTGKQLRDVLTDLSRGLGNLAMHTRTGSGSSLPQVQPPATSHTPPPSQSSTHTNNAINTIPAILPDHPLTPLRLALFDKLQRRLDEHSRETQITTDAYLVANKQLVDSEQRIDSERRRLTEIQNRLSQNISLLDRRCRELDMVIQKVERLPDVEVDEIVGSTTVVYNQLFDVVAEDHAIEDTIYFLSKALNEERIDWTTFQKHARKLATDQFEKRALMKKIRDHIAAQTT
ncbi:hypothetical protein BZG36_03579 [Bifiguratus adelaidae]|uniref:UEV domain-containing protein n=1 Tax=Bifiguratus adelaidae TaxID=1938954 RepID=A0A261Y092_9FUNG|nr:hypothetical protein BZG36_03579 [Bifiguratus adelaidae]